MTSSRLPWRRRVELTAGPLVVLMARLPRVVPFLLVLALVIGGLLTQGVVGAVLLGVLALLLAVLLLLAWPRLDPAARLLRVAVIALLVVRAVSFLS